MNQLILHPRDIFAAPDPHSLHEALQTLGLLGEAFNFARKPHFRPGDHFLELVTFLGCSPVISLGEPSLTGEDFCHIALLPEQASPGLLHGDNIKIPRCPHCRQPQEEWQQRYTAWEADKQGFEYPCPHCQQPLYLPQLKWRQSAGFLRSGIAIWGIYEGEAVPSEQLLGSLEQQGLGVWDYFYLQRK